MSVELNIGAIEIRDGDNMKPIGVIGSGGSLDTSEIQELLDSKTSKTRIDFDGNRTFKIGTKTLNYKELHDVHLAQQDFAFVVYGDRAYLLSYVQDDASSMRELRFQSVIATTDSNGVSNTKTSGIYVKSSDGINIASVTVTDINSENNSYKASAINDTNKNNVWYPSNKAVADYVDSSVAELNDDLSALGTRIEGIENTKIDLQKITKSGYVISIDDRIGSFESLDFADASKVVCINKDTSLFKKERHSVNRGLQFENSDGFLYITGKKVGTTDAPRYWNDCFCTDTANRKTALIGNGNNIRVSMCVKSQSNITGGKITLRILDKNNTSSYKTLLSAAFDGTLKTYSTSYLTTADTEYTFAVIVSGVGDGIDIGCVSVFIGYSLVDDANEVYKTFSVDDEVSYNKVLFMSDSSEYIHATYYRNSISPCNRYMLKTIASERRSACNLLVDRWTNKGILFDLSDATANDVVLSVIKPYKIDAIIISHFHYDHIGMDYEGTGLLDNGFWGLLKSEVSETCMVYIPKRPVNVGTALHDSGITLLDNYGFDYVTVPFSNHSITVGDIDIRFFNVETDEYTTNISGGYNNASLCCEVTCDDKAIYFMGDLYTYAQERCFTNGYIRECDVLIAPHHGLTGKVYKPMLQKMNPSIVIINFGTSYDSSVNEYLKQRSNSSVITEYFSDRDVPVFDVSENNGSFNVFLGNGLDIQKLNSISFYSSIRTYSNSRTAIGEEIIGVPTDESSTMLTLKKLLVSMPVNSSVDLMCYGSYALFKDLFGESYPTTERAIVHAVKTVGGNSNYIFGRSTDKPYESNDFAFSIKATTLNTNSSVTVERVGLYNGSTDVLTTINVS